MKYFVSVIVIASLIAIILGTGWLGSPTVGAIKKATDHQIVQYLNIINNDIDTNKIYCVESSDDKETHYVCGIVGNKLITIKLNWLEEFDSTLGEGELCNESKPEIKALEKYVNTL